MLSDISSSLRKASASLSDSPELLLSALDMYELEQFKSLSIHGTQESLEPSSQSEVRKFFDLKYQVVLNDLVHSFYRDNPWDKGISSDLVLSSSEASLNKWLDTHHRSAAISPESLCDVKVHGKTYTLFAVLSRSSIV